MCRFVSCKFYGNGQNGEGLGACVEDETSPCPQWVETGKMIGTNKQTGNSFINTNASIV